MSALRHPPGARRPSGCGFFPLIFAPVALMTMLGPIMAAEGPPWSRTLNGPYLVLPDSCDDVLDGAGSLVRAGSADPAGTTVVDTPDRVVCDWTSAEKSRQVTLRVEVRRYGLRRWARGVGAAHQEYERLRRRLTAQAGAGGGPGGAPGGGQDRPGGIGNPGGGNGPGGGPGAPGPAGVAATPRFGAESVTVTGTAPPDRRLRQSAVLLLRGGNAVVQVAVRASDAAPDPTVIRARAVAVRVLEALEDAR